MFPQSNQNITWNDLYVVSILHIYRNITPRLAHTIDLVFNI